ATGHRFLPASDDVGGRQMVLQGWLYPSGSQLLPKLRIVTHRCPQLCEQLTKVKKKVVAKEEVDERKAKGPVDLCDCLEYFAASTPRYVLLKPSLAQASPAYQRYMKKYGRDTSRPTVRFGI